MAVVDASVWIAGFRESDAFHEQAQYIIQSLIAGQERINMPAIAFTEVAGAIKRETKAILHTLTKRFKTVPLSLEKIVRGITDLERLEQLADDAFDCESIEEFGKALT